MLDFEHTPEAIAFCESLAESHGMLFGACLETGSATFLKIDFKLGRSLFAGLRRCFPRLNDSPMICPTGQSKEFLQLKSI